MKQRLIIYSFFTATILCCNYANGYDHDNNSLYSQKEYWFNNNKDIDSTLVDIFYILPTCIWDWTDENGEIQHYAQVTNPKHRAACKPSFELADQIFADSCNLHAPYYRQISLNSWIEGDQVVNERFPTAMVDIREAFNYFIEYRNNGRPFILAGYSQGAKAVTELVKTMPTELYSRMVAAYAIGYRITSEDLRRHPNLKPAKSAIDIHTTICYNSCDSPAAIPEILAGGKVCINPINWTTSSTRVAMNDTVSIAVDPINSMLILSGLDNNYYWVKSLEKIFPKGNYHLQELNLYHKNLQQNVKQRIRAFTKH